jgi:energy-coupling factor transporter ATP-binding protein EcfA2
MKKMAGKVRAALQATQADLEPGLSEDSRGKEDALALPADFELSEEFRDAFEAIEKTNDCLCVTGEAGTGKTTLLKYLRRHTQKPHVVLAPTGIAAVNCYGQTIHSFFRFPHKLIRREQIRKIARASKIFSRLQLLIIDEASMMRADLLDGIDYALRLNRNRMEEPFGGVQVALFGDLFQLAPIVERDLSEYYGEFYPTPYFFSAAVFREMRFGRAHLRKIYRQRDLDFKSLLNKIRNGTFEEADLERLNSRVDPKRCDSCEDGIILTPTNAAAARINEMRLARLAGEAYAYQAAVDGEFDETSYATSSELRLKVGSQVLMVKNDPEKRWVNGSVGEIVGLQEDAVRVRIGGKVHSVEPATWEKIRYRYDRQTGEISEEVTGSFRQYPVKLAWAMTIHKSQGLTFEKVILDLHGGAFAHGQVYVALSRCRSMEGLALRRPVRARDIIFDERVQNFTDEFSRQSADVYA